MAKVRGSYVVVVGCGGVGSWAALMLLRRYAHLARYPMLTFQWRRETENHRREFGKFGKHNLTCSSTSLPSHLSTDMHVRLWKM